MKLLAMVIATCKTCPYFRQTNDWNMSEYCTKSKRKLYGEKHGIDESDGIPDWCELGDVKL